MAQILVRLNPILCHRNFLPWLILVALVLRLGVALAFPLPVTSDAEYYAARAVELIQRGTYSDNGIPTSYWPVGYPFVLSIFMRLWPDAITAGITINLLATVATLYLIVRIAARFTVDVRVGRFAALLFAFYPGHILYTGQLLTEPVYIALFLLAFWLLVQSRNWKTDFLAGILFGLATYIKSQTWFFPVGLIIALWMVYRHYHWKRAAVAVLALYVGLFAVILPWSFRNQAVFGSFVMLSTNGGPTLYDGNNPLADGGYSGFPLGPKYVDVLPKLAIQPDEYVARQVEWDALTKKMATTWIKQNPGAFIAAMPRKLFLLWGVNTDSFYAPDKAYPEQAKLLKVGKIINLAYYALIMVCAFWAGIVALRGLWQRNEAIAPLALLYTFPVFTTLIAMVFSGQSRFNLPCMPLLMIAASWVVWRQIEHKAAKMGSTAP
jgi:4-amino-4-deoxy-L-arabinose transferase-like glycosyltransferase